jgi:large repetitive protein
VAAGTAAGSYVINYTICETLNPTNCRDASITVNVVAAVISADPDAASGVNGATGAAGVANVLDGDTLNGVAATLATVDLSVTTPATPINGGPVPVLNTATGLVDVPAGTPAGTYSITYQICEELNPTNCSSNTVSITVDPSPLTATNDVANNVNGASGATAVANAFTSDTVNGVAASTSNATLSVKAGTTVPAGLTFDTASGNVDVAAGTAAGSYVINYTICETLNPTNCRDASITVNVVAAVISADADDAGSVPGIAGGSDLINVLANDTLNGQPVNIADIALTVTTPASNPGVTLDPTTAMVSVAPNTPAGTYIISYQICERLNPANCATATIAVVVQAAAIVAAPDAPAAVNGATGSNDIINAFSNDLLNGVPVVVADITATVTTPATPVTPGAPVPVMDPATGLVDVPAGTPAGTYTITYQICESLNPSNCSTSSVTIVVLPAAIVAGTDAPPSIRSDLGNPTAVNAFGNDTLNGVPVDPALISATVLTPASNPGVALDPVTGNVSVAPNTPAGTYTIEYQICERLNPTNCATSTVTIVVDPPVGAISGTVYQDLDGDRTVDANEPRRVGWIVEIIRDGVVVATATTDAQGNYSIPGLLSGPGYSIQFRNPENNVVYNRINDVTVNAGGTVIDQNQPIDPSGVFYDSVTRQPIAGVAARLTDANGVPLPTICFLDPSQANQTSGSSGEYRFDIVPGAAPQCPVGETVYRIVATPPAGFAAGSTVVLPLVGPFDPTGMSAPVRINPTNEAPTGPNPPYYLNFRLATGDPDIINNHIALDPFLTRTPLVVTKTSVKRSASVGDIVPYEITVRNTENVQRAGVDVVDILPAGMKYVLGTSLVNGAAQEPVATNTNRELTWRGQVIPANGSVRYNLTLIVGAGVTGGEKVNTGVAENGATGSEISNRGTAVVTITPNAVFDCSELLGKVFEDTNRNGYQDENEPGVPGVRMATVNGQLITTDEFGRYHIACAVVPDARIGSNFVVKVDTHTLPLGWDVTTDNPRSIRLTRGKFGELNFGVAPKVESSPPPGVPSVKTNEKGE